MTDRPDDDAGDRLEALLAEHRDPPAAEEEAAPFDPFAPIPAAPAADPKAPGAGEGGVEADGADGADKPDPLPDAPLFALLRHVEREMGVDRIDRIWVFPPRRLEAGETAVVVVSAFPELDDARRRVYAAHYTASEEAREPRLALDEYGTAPTERVGRLVEEVVERLKDQPAEAPRSHDVGGRDDLWNTVLHDLAEAHLAEVQKNPRLRR